MRQYVFMHVKTRARMLAKGFWKNAHVCISANPPALASYVRIELEEP
jgi:hypothetical protein